MARIRYLKPDFFKDEDLRDLPFGTRLFFAGLWCQADKAGRLEDRPERLKVEIMPYDDFDAEAALRQLAKPKRVSRRPYIIRYRVDGQTYVQILSWSKHQCPHHTERDSKIPPPPNTPLNGNGEGNGNGECEDGSTELRNGSITVKQPLLRQIIEYFNQITGQKRSLKSGETIKLISGRLSEGRTFEDFKHVIDTKTAQWRSDQKMRRFLRPSTLFRPGNFEDYLNEPYQSPGQSRPHEPGEPRKENQAPFPYSLWTQVAETLIKKGFTEEQLMRFHTKAKQAFPAIKDQWEKSDGRPGTFIRLVDQCGDQG